MHTSAAMIQQRSRNTIIQHRHRREDATDTSLLPDKRQVGKIVGIAIVVFLIANAVIFVILTSFYNGTSDVDLLRKTNITVDSNAISNGESVAQFTPVVLNNNPDNKGLYRKSTDVLELWSTSEVDKLLEDKYPTVIVFYASWCPHCRHFEPIFDAYAKKVHTVAENLHREIALENLASYHGSDKRPFHINFAAVDCPKVTAACDRQKVQAYPTVVAFHFTEKNATKLGPQISVGSIREVDKLLKRLLFEHGELDDARLTQQTSATSAALLASTLPPQKKSHSMSAIFRYEDAWTSFAYFLAHELPKDPMTNIQADNLRQMMTLFQFIFTTFISSSPRSADKNFREKVQVRLQFLRQCDIVFRKYANHWSAFPTNKIQEVVKQYIAPQQLIWQGCGVSSTNPSSTVNTVTASIRSIFTSTSTPTFDNSNNNIRKRINESDVNSDASSVGDVAGYSCGLWMMFHVFTLSASKVPFPRPLHSVHQINKSNSSSESVLSIENLSSSPSSAVPVRMFTAFDVRTVIHDFVAVFFRCFSCRSHFLHSYDACFFHHCHLLPLSASTISTNNPMVVKKNMDAAAIADAPQQDFAHLQYWLFQLHTLVTHRIILEDPTRFLTKNLTLETIHHIFQQKLWPSQSQCVSCYAQPSLAQGIKWSLEIYRQKKMRKREFAHLQQISNNRLSPRATQTPIVAVEKSSQITGVSSPQNRRLSSEHNNSAITVNNSRLRGSTATEVNNSDKNTFFRFETEEDLEWFLLHVIDHLFNKDAVLQYLQQTAYSLE